MTTPIGVFRGKNAVFAPARFNSSKSDMLNFFHFDYFLRSALSVLLIIRQVC